MLPRVVAVGCCLALSGMVCVASAADSPTTQPTTRNSGRPSPRGGFGGVGPMGRPGPFGGGGMGRGGPGAPGAGNMPGPEGREGFPMRRGLFGGGGGFAQGGNGPGENNRPFPGRGRGFGGGMGGGVAVNPPGAQLNAAHPFLSRLDALLMAVHRELMQEEQGAGRPDMGGRGGPLQGPMARRGNGPDGRFFEAMRRARLAREREDFGRERGFGPHEGRWQERGMWGRESFGPRFGRFRGEERRGEFRPGFGRMYDDREMPRHFFRGGPPPLGPLGPGRFERFREGFGPGEGRGRMMERFDRFGPPDREGRFGAERGRWMERGGPEQEEGFRPRRPEERRFDGRGGFGPDGGGQRGMGSGWFDRRGAQADDRAPSPRRPYPSRSDERDREDGR